MEKQEILTNEELRSFKKYPGKEKEFGDYLYFYMKYFCKDVLGEEFVKCEREFSIGEKTFAMNRARVDFALFTKNGLILIEIKNPYYIQSEMASGIGQSLMYLSEAKANGLEVYRNILLTSRACLEISRTIDDLKLPIELFIVSEDKTLKLTGIKQGEKYSDTEYQKRLKNLFSN